MNPASTQPLEPARADDDGATGQEPLVLTCGELGWPPIRRLLERYGLELRAVADGAEMPGSYWGAPEAGLVGRAVIARSDTPVHSLLHEACHAICCDEQRRQTLDTEAGGDDAEENGVCYLQIVLGGLLPGASRERLQLDMDRWGYSFRLGSTRAWFEEDAEDARAWLVQHGLLTTAGQPIYRLRP
ncbi:MAG: hypothetical protein AAF725_09785 [Acidobacteriota bacterium]